MAIRVLKPEVAAQIAAGEVVERPASIIKELVENAIDAGATRITVDLQGGGLTALRVTDNGGGMAREDLPLAFARHATSKLDIVDDLDHLLTLGFRGEALASIGAVAEVTLASRPADAPSGAQIDVRHGALGNVVTTAMPQGTIVTVRDLFAQVPARLKFLKSRQGEAGFCVQLLDRLALAYPEIAFTVLNDGRLALRTPGDGLLESAVAQVYDVRTADQMVPLSYGEDVAADVSVFDRPPMVTGLTSRPAAFKTTRHHMLIFVNRRWVKSQALSHAVEEAYHSLLLTGRHPISIINIALDPALVDVNVHPAKTEVKFARERQVYAAVQRAVRAAVLATTEAPALSAGAFTPQATPASGISAPTNWEEMPEPPDGETPVASVPQPAPMPTGERPELAYVPPGRGNIRPSASTPVAPMPAAPTLWRADELRGTGRPSGERIPVATPPPPPHLPALRVLGQVSQSYIITEGPDGVYLIDQHAAHERILLEKMVAEWRANGIPSQLLLEPIVVELEPETFAAIEERQADLVQLAFDIEVFGTAALLVRAVPAPLAKHATADDLRDLLPELVGTEGAGHGETWEEHALANVACKAAIRAGQTLSPDEQRALVRQLETVDARHSCCHGRPTTVHLSLEALEKEFARR